MNISDLIQPHHLTRRAKIYLRQSTPQQVTDHQESLRLQYALKQRALDLGWPESSIDIIDADLGRSGATTEGRQGFQELVAQVALGLAGIVIAYDATRLARNCSHWYQLLDLCGRAACLIADRDGVYDPSSVNGRLLLGLKGQISELELHTLRARLTAGILSKAKRGELAVCLPTGLVRNTSGEVVKHPNREVQDRISLIFRTMLEKGAVPRVMRLFRQSQLLIPGRDRYGDIQWRQPTCARLAAILTNPAYAGAFAYGQRRRYEDGLRTHRRKRLPSNEWKVLVKDKYPAYVSWDDFEKIDAMLKDNHSEYKARQSRGIPRDGKALLQGIVYCGECGHKMKLHYKKYARYICSFFAEQANESVCQHIPADQIDPHMIRWFFEALSTADIDLSARILAEADQRRDELFRAQRQQVERLRHEAHLTERQYRHSEPENRLVTAELERRWEMALRELKRAEETLALQEKTTGCWAIPADLLDALKDIGRRLPELWDQEILSWSQKKALFRCLVDKVVLRRQGDQVHARVVWRGGDTSSTAIPITVGRFGQLLKGKEIEATIRRLAKEGHRDKEIATELTAAGYRSPRSPVVLPSTVAAIRWKHGIFQHAGFPKIIPGYLRASQIAKRLKVSAYWIYDRINNGTIQIAKDPKYGAYLFPDKPETLKQFRQLLAGTIKNLRY
jgi:DNA invertase Pin-like site-specific DNA recombinase